ncbi:ubiquitin 3 binding protein But2 C-terminal domain-containing protein [Bisporella sp. PMI_857]|nr:ubiquitin 3 binding protein But2 C-terminal domain-containing protein [Bisporella sp. PMI_857]
MFAIFTFLSLAAAAALPPTIARPTNSSISKHCRTSIAGGPFVFPHLIIPTSKLDPHQAPGAQRFAEISSRKTTLFSFDIINATEYISHTCALIFQFPFKTDIVTAPKYEWTGLEAQEYSKGGLNFAKLAGNADLQSTFANTPPVAEDYGKTAIIPGNTYTITKFPCAPGQVTFSASSIGVCDLKYFESSEVAAPQGLFVVPCAE